MIISRDEVELEVVLQEYTYRGVKRLVLHLDPTKSIPLHPLGYDGITLIKLAPNDIRDRNPWKGTTFPYILYWATGHKHPIQSWKSGLEVFERMKQRFLEKLTKEARS